MTQRTSLEFKIPPARRQAGAVQLFVTMVLLLIVMLLGVAASLVSGTQFRLAGNLQFENAAFNLAENAAAAAENWLFTGDNFADSGFVTYSTSKRYFFPIGSMSAQGVDPLAMSWSDSNSCALPITIDPTTNALTCTADASASATQRFVIEKIGANNRPLGAQVNNGGRLLAGCQQADLYRITARGASARSTTKMVQATVAVPSC